MEGLYAAHDCSLSFLFDHLQTVDGLHFFLLLFLGLLSLVVFLLVCVLLLLLCVLHDDQFLQILDFLPHVADDLILPLNLRPEIQDFPLVASLLSLHLCLKVIINPDDSILKHPLISIQLLTYIPLQSLTKASYQLLPLPNLMPGRCYPLLFPSEALYLLLQVLQ